MIFKFTKLIFCLLLLTTSLYANTKHFEEGVSLFNNNKLKEAKFKFEQDIVFNPKNELSYMYLAKIFKSLKKKI